MKISYNMIFIHDKPLQKQYHPSNYYEHVGAATAFIFVSIPICSVVDVPPYELSIVNPLPAAWYALT